MPSLQNKYLQAIKTYDQMIKLNLKYVEAYYLIVNIYSIRDFANLIK